MNEGIFYYIQNISAPQTTFISFFKKKKIILGICKFFGKALFPP